MSNNLIRKGLAVLASSVLALTGVTAMSTSANAYTGGTVAYTLAPEYGAATELSVPSSYDFVLKLTPNSGFAHTAGNLQLAVDTSASNGGFGVEFASSTNVIRGYTGTGVTTGNAIVAGDANMLNSVAINANTTQFLTVRISDTSVRTDTTYRVKFTVFEQNDGVEGPTGSEFKSNTIEVSFTKHADLGLAVSMDVGTNTNAVARKATVTGVAGLNIRQMLAQGAGALAVAFQTAPASDPANFTFSVSDEVERDATTGAFEAFTGNLGLNAGDRLRAQLLFETTGDSRPAANDTNLGAADVVASVISVMATPTITALSQVNSLGTANTTVMTSNAVAVRSGATSLSAYTDATVIGSASKTGIPVSFKISEATGSSLATGASITTGGKTLTNTNSGTVQFIEVVVNTVATPAGEARATLNLTAAGVANTNAITIEASAQGKTGTLTTYTWTVPTIAKVAQTNVIAGDVVVPAATAFPITIGVSDQWGQAISGSEYSVSVTPASGVTGSALTAPVVNGVATVQWPALATTGLRTWTLQGLKNNASAGSSATASAFVGTSDTAGAISHVGSAASPGANFGVGTDADLKLNLNKFVNADTRVGNTANTDTGSSGVLVTGVVTTVAGGAARTAVTLSGTGLDFVAGGVERTGSITVQTASDGSYSVRVLSSLSGAKTLTISSGSVSKTQAMVFAAAAVDSGTVLTVTAPKSVKSGRTMTFTVSLKDDFGNGVEAGTAQTVRISYNGGGFTLTNPTAFDANGLAYVRVLLNSGDTGPTSVTASVYGGTTSALSASTATWVGPIANAKAGEAKGRVIIEAYRAKGKTVSVFVGGTRVASYVADKANFSKVVRGIKSGTRNVSVRLSGPGEDFRGVITVK